MISRQTGGPSPERLANALTERRGGRSPDLAGEVLGDDRHLRPSVDVVPRDVAPGDHPRADGAEVAGRYGLHSTHRRRRPGRVAPARRRRSGCVHTRSGPSIGTALAKAAAVTPGSAAILSRISCCIRVARSASGTCCGGTHTLAVCRSAAGRESGLDVRAVHGTSGSSGPSRRAAPAPAPPARRPANCACAAVRGSCSRRARRRRAARHAARHASTRAARRTACSRRSETANGKGHDARIERDVLDARQRESALSQPPL